MSIFTRFIHLMKIPTAGVLIAAALILSAIPVSAEYLIVNFKNGSTTSFDLNEKPDVSFDKTQMLIKSSAIETSYNVNDVEKFTFDDKLGVLDKVLGENETRIIYRDRDYIEIHGLESANAVTLYSVAGQSIMTARADDSGVVAFDLSPLAHGVYIIFVSTGQTFKISR